MGSEEPVLEEEEEPLEGEKGLNRRKGRRRINDLSSTSRGAGN